MLMAAVLWLSIILASMIGITVYSYTPGDSGMTPIDYPKDSRIHLDPGRPTLIMFAHPRCPCTRASISELDQLMADSRGQINAQVWFAKLDGTPEDWTDTDLWRKASAIPGVGVYRDDGGVEALRFRAKTSGQILLYGPDGKLLFHGGITISRGHAGDSPGLAALEALVNHQSLAHAETPVFGCPLFAASTNRNCGRDPLCHCNP